MRAAVPIVLLLVCAAAGARAQTTPTAEDLLKAADRARGGLEKGITWEVKLVASEDGDRSERTFVVRARGDNANVESLAPPRTKGEVMLFNDRTIWYVKPGLRKPISISARQKLSGLAANGDIASTQYARDYAGTVAGEETLDGVKTWKLELKAKAGNVTYDRIRYWIAQEQRLGVKAEFLTVDGKVFKTATFQYTNKLTVDGAEQAFVSAMNIVDASSQDTTEIRYGTPRAEEHAASMFNVNNIVR